MVKGLRNMNDKNQRSTRIKILCAFSIFAFLCFFGILYDVQVNHYEEYLSQSIRSIAIEEKVEASRGIITDRKVECWFRTDRPII